MSTLSTDILLSVMLNKKTKLTSDDYNTPRIIFSRTYPDDSFKSYNYYFRERAIVSFKELDHDDFE